MRCTTKRSALLGALLVYSCLVLACRPAATPASGPDRHAASTPAAMPNAAPTLDELGNAGFTGLREIEGTVRLADGRWEGAPYAPGAASRPTVTLGRDFRVTGDLDGDGREEAVVVLAQGGGGSGSYNYLAVVRREGGALRNVATIALGDRVAIRSARIEAGTLHADVLRAGPGDAMCCPGELSDLAWRIAPDGTVQALPERATRRLTLDVLAGSEWTLVAWDAGEPTPDDPAITLAFRDGRVGGSAGCNRYFASPQPGPSPGELAIGPVGTTRMACPDALAGSESRYLQQLQAVRRFGFLLGRLALSYQHGDGAIGTMLFEERATPP